MISYQDIFDADVIIMSFQFLLNVNYIFSNSGQKSKGSVDQELIKRRKDSFLPKARKVCNAKQITWTKTSFFLETLFIYYILYIIILYIIILYIIMLYIILYIII
jgi:hypothetical protein